jgi:hypothetical protein
VRLTAARPSLSSIQYSRGKILICLAAPDFLAFPLKLCAPLLRKTKFRTKEGLEERWSLDYNELRSSVRWSGPLIVGLRGHVCTWPRLDIAIH